MKEIKRRSCISLVILLLFLDAPGGTKLISVPKNTTVLRQSLLSLTCQTDGSPEAEFHLYFNGHLIKTSGSGIFHVSVMSDGSYTCVPFNKVGIGKNASVIVAVVGKFTWIDLCMKRGIALLLCNAQCENPLLILSLRN